MLWHGSKVTSTTKASLSVWKAAADPLRIRMGLLLLEEPHTVKELAAALDVPPTRLYYHVRLLEEHGLIEVVERRLVSGIEERRYRAIEDRWNALEFPESLPESEDAVAALLSAVRAEITVALHDQSEPNRAVPALGLTELSLTDDDLAELQRRLAEIMEDFDFQRDAPAGARRYRFLMAAYLAPGSPDA